MKRGAGRTSFACIQAAIAAFALPVTGSSGMPSAGTKARTTSAYELPAQRANTATPVAPVDSVALVIASRSGRSVRTDASPASSMHHDFGPLSISAGRSTPTRTPRRLARTVVDSAERSVPRARASAEGAAHPCSGRIRGADGCGPSSARRRIRGRCGDWLLRARTSYRGMSCSSTIIRWNALVCARVSARVGRSLRA